VTAPPLVRRLQRPGAFRRSWEATYDACYEALRVGTSLIFRSLFHVRRVEPRPRTGKWDALPAETVLLCPNHQSYLDPAFVQLVVNRRVLFVMTDTFYRRRGANVFFRLVGALPVAKGRMTWSTMRRAIALLRCGRSLVVFPEGRLSTDGELSPAQRGVAVIARRAGVPVVPVAIEGSRFAWPRGSKWLHRAEVRLAVGSPTRWSGAASRERDQAFADRVLEEIAAMRGRLLGRGAPVVHNPVTSKRF
jgi:1-acyl-sn-glycerol-3-phosphate acyltransferase